MEETSRKFPWTNALIPLALVIGCAFCYFYDFSIPRILPGDDDGAKPILDIGDTTVSDADTIPQLMDTTTSSSTVVSTINYDRFRVGGRKPYSGGGITTPDYSDDSSSEKTASTERTEVVPTVSKSDDRTYSGGEMWRIVVGSVGDQSKAEAMRDKLGSSGAEVIYVSSLNTYRVVYGSYADLGGAQQAIETIQARYPQAWMVRF